MTRAIRRVALLLLGAQALVQAGCMLAAVGAAAAGGAAAGYVYYKGTVSRDYPTSLADALAALRASLFELQFPVVGEEAGAGEAHITTRTTDGTTVRIRLETVPSQVPVEHT